MTDIVNTATIKVVADASGVEAGLRPVDDAVAKTGKNLENLGATAKSTGKAIEDMGRGPGLTGVGEGASDAAGKVDRATKSMADSIQRATASMGAGSKGSSEYYAALANQRGLNIAALRPYLDQLDAATKKTELAAQAQRKLDESTKFLESLKSRTDGIGKTAADLAEMRAAQLGVSESAAPMIERMREAEKGAGGMLAAFTPLRIAMAALAALTAGGVLLGTAVKDSIDAAAGMHDLSIQTGASVAALMEFKRIGETSDTSVETISGAMNKLAKGMAVSNEESKGLGQALKAIGLDFNRLKAMSPEQQMIAVAQAMDNFQDGAGKSAVAMTLYGKEGAKLLPFLGDVAAETDNLAKSLSAQEVASKKAMAAMADNFGDNLTLIGQGGAAMKKEISYAMLPGLYEASQAFLDVTSQAGGLKDIIKGLADDGSIARWTRAGITAITYLLDGFQYLGRAVEVVGKAIGAGLAFTMTGLTGAAKAASEFAHGEFKQGWETAKAAQAAMASIGKSFVADVSSTFSEDTLGAKLRARIGEIQKVGAEVGKAKKSVDYDGNSDGGAAAAAKEASAYATVTAAIQAKIEENRLEVAVGEAATESQKLQIKVDQELATGKLKLSDDHKTVVQAKLAELAASEQLVKAQLAEKDSMAWMQQSAQARNAANDALATEYAMYGKTADARDIAMIGVKAEVDLQKFLLDERRKGIEISQEYLAQLEAERDMRVEVEQAALGQTKALGYAGQLKEENKKFNLQYLADDKARAAAQLSLDSEVWQERIRLAGEGTEAQKILQQNFDTWYQNQSAKPFLDEQKKTWDGIESAAHDTFLSIENGSKSAGERAKQALKNGLFEWLWQLAAKPIYMDIRAAFTSGGISIPGVADGATAAAGAAGSGISGLIGAVQSASSLYKAVSGGIGASLAGGIGSLGTALGSNALQSFAHGLAGFSPTGAGAEALGVNSSWATAGGYAGTAASYGAGLIGGHYIGNAIAGDYSVAHGQSVTNIAAVAGAIVGGPIGGAIGGAIGGLINRAFGMGSKDTQTTGISGTLSDSSISASSFAKWKQEGGWFRSDKSGTDTKSLSSDAIAAITNGLNQIKGVSSAFAASLSVDASSIASYTKSFNIDLGKDGKIEDGITQLLTTVGDELATKLVPNIAQFSKTGETAATTLERLAGDFDTTTQMAQLLGKTAVEAFGSAGIASAAAREHLIDLAGSASNLTSWASSYAQNYLSEEERLAPVKKAVDAAMSSLGLAAITTRDQFKQVVSSLDLTTDAGAKQFTSMMQLADAFAQVHAASTSLVKSESAIADERSDLFDQLDQVSMSQAQLAARTRNALAEVNRPLYDMLQAAQKLADTSGSLTTFRDSARSLYDSLTTGSLSTLTPEQQEAELKSQYQKIKAAALAGDETAQGKFSDALDAWLTASQKLNSGDSQYQADFAMGQQDAAAAAAWASSQITAAQAQLSVMNSQAIALESSNTLLTGANKILDVIAQNTTPAPIQSGFVLSNALSVLGSAVKMLQESNAKQQGEVAALRQDQQVQTGDTITANAKVQQQSTQAIVSQLSALGRAFSSSQKVTLE